jgi:hypothetical protein
VSACAFDLALDDIMYGGGVSGRFKGALPVAFLSLLAYFV